MNRGLCTAFVMAAVGVLVTTSIGYAQQKLVRIRGTIEKVDGQNLEVKSREGKNLKVVMSEKVRFTAMEKASHKDLTPDAYFGDTAMPQAVGSQRALAIHIFPPAQRGTGEGHYPWTTPGSVPNSTMTNATVDTTVTSVEGQVLTVKYKGGTQKIIIGPDASIVSNIPGSAGDLKPGVAITVPAAEVTADGSLETARVNIGRGDFVP